MAEGDPIFDPEAGDYESSDNPMRINLNPIREDETFHEAMVRIGLVDSKHVGSYIYWKDRHVVPSSDDWIKIKELAGEKGSDDTGKNIGGVVKWVRGLTKWRRG